MPEIQRVSIRHEAIMDYMMSYPLVQLGDVARAFNVTQPWLSCIIHSDAFQEMLREKQGVAFHHSILPIREKMLNVAHLALDELAATIPLEREAKNLSSIAGDVLERLGYSSKVPAVQLNVQNNVTVLRDEIREAQSLLGAASGRPALEGSTNGASEEIQGARSPALGADSGEASFALIQRTLGPAEAGDSLREEGALEAGGAV